MIEVSTTIVLNECPQALFLPRPASFLPFQIFWYPPAFLKPLSPAVGTNFGPRVYPKGSLVITLVTRVPASQSLNISLVFCEIVMNLGAYKVKKSDTARI